MKNIKNKSILVALLAFTVIVSGCIDMNDEDPDTNGEDYEGEPDPNGEEETNGEETNNETQETTEDETDEIEPKTVSVVDNDFEPDQIELETGQDIIFENEGQMDHTVTIDELDVDRELASGESTSVTVDEEGEFEVYCRLHAEQEATITVA